MESPGRTLHDLDQLDLVITIQDDAEVPTMPQFVSRAYSLSFHDPTLPMYEFLSLIEGLAFLWARLECLRLIRTDIALSECMDLLLRAPFLEECYLYITRVGAEEGRTTEVTAHPNLHS